MKRAVGLAVLVGAIASAVPAEAVSLHSIYGYVRDPRGQVIASGTARGSARVTDNVGGSTDTNAEGRYLLQYGASGTYDLIARRGSDLESVKHTVTIPVTALSAQQDFVLPYVLRATPDSQALTTASVAKTVTLSLTSHAPDPGSPGEVNKSCVEVKDSRTGVTTPATYVSTSGTAATWSWSTQVPKGTPQGRYTLTAVAKDCASGLVLSKVEGYRTEYIVDNTPPSIPADSLIPADGTNTMYSTAQPLAARITDGLSGVSASSVKFTLYDAPGNVVYGSGPSQVAWNAATGYASTTPVGGMIEGRIYYFTVTARDRAGNETVVSHKRPVDGGGFYASHATGTSTTVSIPSTACEIAAQPDATGFKDVWCRAPQARLEQTTAEVGGMRHFDSGYLSQTFPIDSAILTTDIAGAKVPYVPQRDATWGVRTRSQRFEPYQSTNGVTTVLAELTNANIGLVHAKVPGTWTNASIEMGSVATTPTIPTCPNPTTSTAKVPCSPDAFDARFIVRLKSTADGGAVAARHAAEHNVVVRERIGNAYSAYIPPEALQTIANDTNVASVTRETAASELYPDDWATANIETDDYADALRTEFGSRYGGDWIDLGVVPSVWRIGIKGMTTADRERVDEITEGGNGRVVATPVTYSEADFESYASTAESVLDSHGVALLGWGYDGPDQKLVLNVESITAAAKADLEAALPAGVLRLRTNAKMQLNHVSRAQGLPLEGGLEVAVGNGKCTTAFPALRISDNTTFGVTAGHCGQAGAPVTMAGLPSGTTVTWSGFVPNGVTRSDALTFRVGQIPQANVRATVLVGPDVHRNIQNFVWESGLTPGKHTCFQGATSHPVTDEKMPFINCGRLEGPMRNFTFSNATGTERSTMERVWCFDVHSKLGDSGGPVYNPHNPNVTMMGLLTGSVEVRINDVPQAPRTCFTSLEAFERQSGLRIMTSNMFG